MPEITPRAIAWQYLVRHRSRYLIGSVLLLVTNALGLALPWILGLTITALEQGTDHGTIARYALLVLGLALATAVVRVGSRILLLGGSREIEYGLRQEVYHRLVYLGQEFYDRNKVGDLMSRVSNDVRTVRSLFGPGFLYAVNAVFLYAIGITIVASIDWQLTLISFVPFLILVFAIWRSSRAILGASRAAQRELGDLTATLQENLTGILVIRSYAAGEAQAARFDAHCQRYRDQMLSMARVRGIMMPIFSVGTGVGTLLVLYLGGQKVIGGSLSLGQFVSFLAYLGMLAWPTFALGWVVNILQRSRPALERVAEVLNQAPEPIAEDAPAWDTGPGGAVEARGLTWEYAASPGRRAALTGISFHIPAGELVALIGRVGAGKSTLLSLLSRLYSLDEGVLFLDGQDIATLPLEQLRRAVVQVPQEAFLFSRSIRENIAYGEPEAPMPAVRQAAERAQVDQEIETFPERYETLLGERGITLSGGQRQRTTLARALLVEPKVLILDDSTSSLDAETEKEILAEMRRLRAGRTTILVTHRTETMRLCDRLIVLDEGRLEATGRPAEMEAESPTFRQMLERDRLRAEWESRA